MNLLINILLTYAKHLRMRVQLIAGLLLNLSRPAYEATSEVDLKFRLIWLGYLACLTKFSLVLILAMLPCIIDLSMLAYYYTIIGNYV